MSAKTITTGRASADADLSPIIECQGINPDVDLQAMLDGLIPWLNKNLPLDPTKPVTTDDIAHISLTLAEFAQIRADVQRCGWKHVDFKQVNGIEVWVRGLALPPIRGIEDFRGRIAWKMTRSTAALFRRKGAEAD